jgi:hypothetical protein
MKSTSLLDRRTIVTGTFVTGLAAATVSRTAFAQEATPDAAEATPSTPTSDAADESGPAGRGQGLIDRVAADLAQVEGDLAAVRDDLDTTTIDPVIAKAQDLLTQAQTSFEAASEADGIRYAIAAQSALESASLLIDAQLSYPGLPSDQNWASRALVNAFDFIDQIGASATGASGDIDVVFYIETAQSLYTDAYDLYGSGAYAQAGLTGRAAARLGAVATILTASGGAITSRIGGRSRWIGEHQHQGDFPGAPAPEFNIRGGGEFGLIEDIERKREQEQDRDTPIDVPEPTFSR